MKWHMEDSGVTVSRSEYDGALGAYLVLFNRLEVQASEVHFAALHRLDLTHLFRPEAKLIERLVPMEIAFTALRWPKPDFAAIRGINGKRNDIAHGHVHQDPNTGDWQMEDSQKIKRGVSEIGEYSGMTRESDIRPLSLGQIGAETKRIARVTRELQTCMANYWFDDRAP